MRLAEEAKKYHMNNQHEISSTYWMKAHDVLHLSMEPEPTSWEEIDNSSVRKMRLLRRLTTRELANMIEVDDAHITNIEFGKYRNMQDKTKKKLFDALNSHPISYLGVELEQLRLENAIELGILEQVSGISTSFILKIEQEDLSFQQKQKKSSYATGDKNRGKILKLYNTLATWSERKEDAKKLYR